MPHLESYNIVVRPSLSQELFDQLPPLLALLPPPPPEEGGLHVYEPPLRVLGQGGDDAVEDVLDPRPLDVVPVAVVVLVHRLEPAHVVVSVRDPVDVDQAGRHSWAARIVRTHGGHN